MGTYLESLLVKESHMQREQSLKRRVLIGLVVVVLGAFAGVGIERVIAQGTGFKRTPLQKTDDPGAATYEAIQGQADVDPAGTSGMHYHHGIEMGYVVAGEIQIERMGKPTATFKAGEVFLIDPMMHHNATNKGSAPAKIVATYIVEKGKPLAEPVK